MSECVVRMEMPEDCLHCPMVHFDMIGNLQGCEAKPGKRYLQGKEDEFWVLDRPSWCPIICQLPEGHGRLIDAEARVDERILNSDGNVVSNIQHTVGGILGDYAELIPTVVPAERSET